VRYHPLFVFNQLGDIERALLRNGNAYNGSIKSDFEGLSQVVEIVLYIIMLGGTNSEV